MFLKKPKRQKPLSLAAFQSRQQRGRSRTFWNGEPAECTRVRVVMGQAEPGWWCAGMEGTIRDAVKIVYRRQTFYIDNEGGFGSNEVLAEFNGQRIRDHVAKPGDGWLKVTLGMGSPEYAHASITNCEEFVPGAEITKQVEDYLAGQS